MLITDPHVLASELVQEGQAFDDMMESQRKMIDLSVPIWSALMDTALKYKPALVLIPGDLTKDGEIESHELVANSLKQLQAAGIPSLVIPGNHDIGGKAYSYIGENSYPVETLGNEAWRAMYPWVYEQAIAVDEESHSYAAEPLPGLTILAIDGSRDDAGTGELSATSMAFILAQADSAMAKNNTIIAMSHWQILEHFDQQGRLESACRFKEPDALRDSLIAHGVRLILTGHFHVNGITTYHTSVFPDADTIVEITTGSPITYPCPYRWLTLTKDRATVEVETEYITALPEYDDMHAYSRTWMNEHATNMIPQMSLRGWRKIENNMDLVEEQFGKTAADLVRECIPATDSAKVALVQKHLGTTIVELYLLHSDANEPEYPQADSLAQELYTGMDNMMHEVTDEKMGNLIYKTLQAFMITAAEEMVKEPVQSLVEDKTQWKLKEDADRTDDLHLTLTIHAPRADQAIELIDDESLTNRKYIQEGQLFIRRGDQIFDLCGRQIR